MKRKILIATLLSCTFLLGGCSYSVKIGDKEYTNKTDEVENTVDVITPEKDEQIEIEASDIQTTQNADKTEGIETESIVSTPEISETEISTYSESTESVEQNIEKSVVGGVTIWTEDNLTENGLGAQCNLVASDFGGTYAYITGINLSEKDQSIFANVKFLENGNVVDETERYIEMEAGCYEVVPVFTQKEVSEVDVEIEIEENVANIAGKEMDIDYSLDTETGRFYGTVTNNTNETLNYPEVKFVLWDANKMVMNFGNAVTADDKLIPGASTSFEGFLNLKNMQFDTYNIYVTGEVY